MKCKSLSLIYDWNLQLKLLSLTRSKPVRLSPTGVWKDKAINLWQVLGSHTIAVLNSSGSTIYVQLNEMKVIVECFIEYCFGKDPRTRGLQFQKTNGTKSQSTKKSLVYCLRKQWFGSGLYGSCRISINVQRSWIRLIAAVVEFLSVDFYGGSILFYSLSFFFLN